MVRPPPHRSPFLRRAALTVGAGLLALGAVELTARSVSPTPAGDAVPKAAVRGVLFQRDAGLGHVPRAGATQTVWTPEWQARVSVNALGMRGPMPGRMPSTGRRVLALGDSFTFAMQVDDADSFVRRLESTLAEDVPTQVWNGGADDYGTQQALGRARRELQRGIHFDAIVLTVFLGNDLSDNAPPASRAARPPRSLAPAPAPAAVPLFRAVAWGQLWRDRWRARTSEGFADRVRTDFSVWCDDDALEAVLPATVQALADLHALAQSRDVPLVVALAPPQWAVDPSLGHELGDWLGLDGFDPTRVPTRLTSALPPSIPVVDLTAPLRAAAAEQPVSFRYDGHWTPHGHAAVAEALAPVLAETLHRTSHDRASGLVDVTPTGGRP